jgi:SAM-dependent methyltransferase
VSRAFPRTSRLTPSTGLFALTIFLSAFLLFQVQPLIAREILPWFGGSAGVWTACMLFFQMALLGGYGYAHLIASGGNVRRKAWIHCALLAISLACLPIIPSAWWKPSDGSLPLWRILGLLTATVGIPYFLLASTSPLLQSWYARRGGGVIPYRFFALSNFGSMLALISYPIVVEPRLALRSQAWTWSIGYGVFALLVLWIAVRPERQPEHMESQVAEPAARIARSEMALWVALAACASALLLAVTNHITQNVAAIPFLWILPLSLYLLSFILTFESHRWYSRKLYLGLFAVAVGSMGYAISGAGVIKKLEVLIPLFAGGLFICCMVCHGELARRKPPSNQLTSFYLMISAGGALGGLFVAGIAPNVFPALWEFPITLVAIAIAIMVVTFWDRPIGSDRKLEFARQQFWSTWVAAGAATALLAGYLAYQEYDASHDAVVLTRNFYGALRVVDDDELGIRELAHGTINHGEQFLDPVRRRTPITYYAPETGIGMLMADLQKRGPFRLGVVGLGSGTMAAFGRTGDFIRYYEINPSVLRIARTEFTYLKDTSADLQVELGDARLSLEREPSQQFDVLVVDAFSGDSIPIHLLTREAYEIYWRHLKPSGVLAVHVSNKYLDLSPTVNALARSFGKEAHLIESVKNNETRVFASDWVLVGGRLMDRFPWIDEAESDIDPPRSTRLWTDDYSDLWVTLK